MANAIFGWVRLIVIICCSFLSIFVLGCAERADTFGAEVLGYNHTDQFIAAFTINGAYMGRSPSHGQSEAICCIKIPSKWNSKLEVEVSWTKDDRSNEFWKSKVIKIPYYASTGHLAVHFFPHEEVRVIVSEVYVGHERYPFPSPFLREDK
ncbi:DUF3304 domain-containing protein [Cupriavidus alkaliphilus]|uniref:DUF3304 domain-containing protein n=1 Tax=Cupriavidus alkaliphilus TaxID=942866 RepID=UPI000B80D04B|nr:DUF3304 domain-containing protein [Cupriavidus alkaliphilus]